MNVTLLTFKFNINLNLKGHKTFSKNTRSTEYLRTILAFRNILYTDVKADFFSELGNPKTKTRNIKQGRSYNTQSQPDSCIL